MGKTFQVFYIYDIWFFYKTLKKITYITLEPNKPYNNWSDGQGKTLEEKVKREKRKACKMQLGQNGQNFLG